MICLNDSLILQDIMSSNIISIKAQTSMLDIAEIFEQESFHHLPVIDQNDNVIGMLSRSDYKHLQHNFSKKKLGNYEQQNRLYFRSLQADEIMTKHVIALDKSNSVMEAIKIFLVNKAHSVVIKDNGKCVGIVTPYDIFKQFDI